MLFSPVIRKEIKMKLFNAKNNRIIAGAIGIILAAAMILSLVGAWI